MKVKICGITNLEDAVNSGEYGADLLGFIFVKNTPRYISPEDAGQLIEKFREIQLGEGKYKDVEIVGLFKDEKLDDMVKTVAMCGLDYVQLQGNESPQLCESLKKELSEKYGLAIQVIKAFKVKGETLHDMQYSFDDYGVAEYFVFDTYHPDIAGGTGVKFDWNMLKKEAEHISKDFFVAGGLDLNNVAEVVRALHPYGVDVSSGVEKKAGKKDEKLLKEFIKNAKKDQSS